MQHLGTLRVLFPCGHDGHFGWMFFGQTVLCGPHRSYPGLCPFLCVAHLADVRLQRGSPALCCAQKVTQPRLQCLHISTSPPLPSLAWSWFWFPVILACLRPAPVCPAQTHDQPAAAVTPMVVISPFRVQGLETDPP